MYLRDSYNPAWRKVNRKQAPHDPQANRKQAPPGTRSQDCGQSHQPAAHDPQGDPNDPSYDVMYPKKTPPPTSTHLEGHWIKHGMLNDASWMPWKTHLQPHELPSNTNFDPSHWIGHRVMLCGDNIEIGDNVHRDILQKVAKTHVQARVYLQEYSPPRHDDNVPTNRGDLS